MSQSDRQESLPPFFGIIVLLVCFGVVAAVVLMILGK
jgi:hypothetical protein